MYGIFIGLVIDLVGIFGNLLFTVIIQEAAMKSKKLGIALFTVILFSTFTSQVFGHGGGLDANGCHNNRKTGDYHCHGGSSSSKRYAGGLSTPSKSKVTYKKTKKKINPAKQSVKVSRLLDGDTVTVKLTNGKYRKIRLYGIDTPEKGQMGGQMSKQALEKFLKGKRIEIVEKDIDRYGRTIGVIYANGMNVNQAMVANGYAWAYRKYLPSSEKANWVELENSARKSRRGIWQDENPKAPWDWRKDKK